MPFACLDQANLQTASLTRADLAALTLPNEWPEWSDYQAECGSCHAPYPARLLSRTEWQQITGKLDQHFGTDATLDDAAALKKINAFLQANAATQPRTVTAPGKLPRITESRWFIREHDEIGANVWKKPWVKSASNCGACHGGADQGGFSEHDVRIPRQ